MMTSWARSVRGVVIAGALMGASLLVAGCDEQDAASVKIELKPDLSGTIVASGVVIPAESAATEKGTASVKWEGRAGVVVSKGAFASIDSLKIGEVMFETAGAGSVNTTGVPKPHVLRVQLPRGKAVKWAALFAGESEEMRGGVRRVLDPANEKSAIAAGVKLTITVPGKVISSGINMRARALSASGEDKTATLYVPLDLVGQEGAPLVWHVTWE